MLLFSLQLLSNLSLPNLVFKKAFSPSWGWTLAFSEAVTVKSFFKRPASIFVPPRSMPMKYFFLELFFLCLRLPMAPFRMRGSLSA